MTNPKVSIVMPTFNRSQNLEIRYAELLNQTYNNWEMVIVDDASTDDTEKVVKNIGDKRIKYIKLHKNSKSVSLPRAVGISNSDGELICPSDDDVEVFSHKLFELEEAINKNPNNVLSYGDRWSRDINGNILHDRVIENWEPLAPEGWGVDNGQIMYRANVYEKLPLILPNKACDWETAKHIKKLGDFAYTSIPVCIYNWHGSNFSQNRPKERTDPREYERYFKKYEVDWRIL